MAIDINLEWPNGPHSRPTVSNSTSQNNPIPSSQASLDWDLTPAQDNVRITGVTFYASQPDKTRKQNPVTPSYLDLPGGHVEGAPTTWRISFAAGQGPSSLTRLWYDVHFSDDDYNDMDWDPQLTISPR